MIEYGLDQKDSRCLYDELREKDSSLTGEKLLKVLK